MTRLRTLLRHPLVWPVLTLVLLFALDVAHRPGFLSIALLDGHLFGAPIDILNRAAPLVIVSLGMTLVIATGGIDISVGAIVAIAGAAAAIVLDADPSRVGTALAAALAVGLLAGAWNGVLVAFVGMQPIIATLILMVAGRGIAQLITGGQIITVYYAPYFFIGNGYLAGLPFAFLLALAVFAALWFLTRRTALGLFIESVGINPSAAHVAGLPARSITFWVYAFCGVCAGVAGLIVSSTVKSADGNNAGMLMELDAILAVTLGGTALTGGRFSLAGSVIGALIIQTLTYAIYSLGVPPEINLVVKAAVVFAVMLLQSAEFRRTVAILVRRPAPVGAAR
jgi:simple sugar transport system permease protein